MPRGGKSPRRKGTRAELAVTKLLQMQSLPAKRVPLSGQSKDFPGDVLLGDLPLEVKYGLHVPERLYAWLEGKYAVVLRRPYRDWLVVLPLAEFVRLKSLEQEVRQHGGDVGVSADGSGGCAGAPAP